MNHIKILFIGDIVGTIGRKAVKTVLPFLINKYPNSIIIANGENSSGGKGISKDIALELYQCGVHVITMGNHTWDNKDIFNFIDDDNRIIRPSNYPKGTPGRGFTSIKMNQQELIVMNIQGRTFLPAIDCPFMEIDRLLEPFNKKNTCIFVDFHAEATSEKIAMGWYLDGRVSAVIGTHTHVQTNDSRILPKGTAYLTDVGMVGPRDGVLGMDINPVLQKFKTQLPNRFIPAEGKWHFHAVYLEVDNQSGQATKIQSIHVDEDQFVAQ